MSSLIGQLKVLLSLDSAAFETGAKRAQAQLHATGSKAEIMGDKVGRMGKALITAGAALAGSALVGQLASLVRQGLDHASALGEQAQQLGVSTKALQEYRYAATQVGLSQDEMDAALAKLTRSMGEGAQGAKTQAEAFAKLGIDIKAFVASGGEAGDLLPKIAQGLQGIASPADRAAILVDILGKSGQKLMPLLSDGAKGVDNLRDAAARMGLVLSNKQIQDADQVADKLAALQTVLSARIAGIVADNADKIIGLADAIENLATRSQQLYNALVRLGDSSVVRALSRLGEYAALMSPTGLLGKAAGIGLNVTNFADKADAAASARAKAGAGTAWPKGGFSTGAPAKPGSGPMAPEFLKMGTGVGNPFMAAVPIPLMFSMIEGLPEKISLTSEELENLSNMVASLTERLLPGEAALAQYKEEMGALDAAGAAGILSPERLAQLKTALVDTSDGVASMLDRIKFGTNEIQNATDVVQAGIEEIANRSVFAGEKMKGSFLDAADSIISAVDRIGYAFSSGGGGGGFLGKLSAVMNLGMKLGGLGAFGKGFQTNVKALSGARAAGGPVNAGGLYLVGERGPELFAPGQSGNIVPNHALGRQTTVEVVPSPYFNVVVDGRVQQAAPMIAAAGAEGGVRKMAYRQSRRVG